MIENDCPIFGKNMNMKTMCLNVLQYKVLQEVNGFLLHHSVVFANVIMMSLIW